MIHSHEAVVFIVVNTNQEEVNVVDYSHQALVNAVVNPKWRHSASKNLDQVPASTSNSLTKQFWVDWCRVCLRALSHLLLRAFERLRIRCIRQSNLQVLEDRTACASVLSAMTTVKDRRTRGYAR